MPYYTKHKQQRVGVFVDVSNMYHCSRNLYKAKVNFEAVLKAAVAGRKLIRAFAYVIEADVEGEKGFFEVLESQGFEVRAKAIQVFPGGIKKGDWDVGLCIDVVRLTPLLDAVVLVSGDGDYADLLDYLRGHGRRTEVISFGKTTSHHLIEAADEFLDMDKAKRKFLIPSRR